MADHSGRTFITGKNKDTFRYKLSAGKLALKSVDAVCIGMLSCLKFSSACISAISYSSCATSERQNLEFTTSVLNPVNYFSNHEKEFSSMRNKAHRIGWAFPKKTMLPIA
jgi:hypothetical protein